MPTTNWRGRIVFGLVTVPVFLVRAVGRIRISFHYVCNSEAAAAAGAGANVFASELGQKVRVFQQRARAVARRPLPQRFERVRSMYVGELSNRPLTRDEMYLGCEVGPDGRWAVFTFAEMNALRAPSSRELEITNFVPLNQIDPIFYEASYFLRPDYGGDKPYALLHELLARNNHAAIGELPFSGREYTVAVRAGLRGGLVLHQLYFGPEVKAGEEFPADRRLVTEEELRLGNIFLNTKKAVFDPSKLKDKLDERKHQLILTRSRETYPAEYEEEPAKMAPVLDIEEALRKSVARARKKPVQRESGRGKPRGKKGHNRRK